MNISGKGGGQGVVIPIELMASLVRDPEGAQKRIDDYRQAASEAAQAAEEKREAAAELEAAEKKAEAAANRRLRTIEGQEGKLEAARVELEKREAELVEREKALAGAEKRVELDAMGAREHQEFLNKVQLDVVATRDKLDAEVEELRKAEDFLAIKLTVLREIEGKMRSLLGLDVGDT